ncbi:hypothetical protein W03_23930 [Nitrosomonas sp. PY1]|uniref:Calx-beta domain-containing protein n=1 Tax=Nitrosomonas sp. PY1 TaxID=1803906 RepID=UPI001FC7CC09|nr:Calx-beta domain-containing protein [Nitrosomonas sp. PY1]GKS70389.1 hypothetical protein W03_23930 [Nitrosomonas sp. PY1]
MATTVSVSFANGFVGDAVNSNSASNCSYLVNLGWSNFQFSQSSSTGQFGGSQGNDYAGTIHITDANGVRHSIDGVINWRAPSGSVTTMVFYATGAGQTLATTNSTYSIDPWSGVNGDPHTYIGLTFNGATLTMTGGQVSGNATTSGLLSTLNTYLANQPQISINDLSINEGSGTVSLTASLNKTSTDTITVAYQTADGTASAANADYTSSSGVITFNPGETSKTINIPISDDSISEGTENLKVVLSDSTYAAIVKNTGTITIIDNDGQSVTSVIAEDAANTGANPVDSTVVEGANLRYTVNLNAASPSATEHTLAISGTASISDYGSFIFSSSVTWKNNDPTTGIVVVPANVTSFSITVPTIDDSIVESAESLILTVGGVIGTGTITDNDIDSDNGNIIPEPVVLDASLSLETDDGRNNYDNFTSNINPVIQIDTKNLKLNAGSDRVFFYDLNGNLIDSVDSMLVNSNDAETGVINIQAPQLDDGTYSLVSKILDHEGNVKAIIPITFTIQTDLDGINPSTELAANNGDYNQDGIADWKQNNVAQFPMSSVTDFQAGRSASPKAFGALLIGDIDSSNISSSVNLNTTAQLKDIYISEPPAPLPDDFVIASPMLSFSITNENEKVLQDVSPTTDGFQTRVVIELPNGGVRANSYLKWNETTREWVKFNDDQRLDTFDDGATLLDVNNDGLIDRIVVTLTDGGIGDHDATANGTFVDPVVLAWQPISNVVSDPVYSVLLANGDRYYTTDIKEAAQMAHGSDNIFEGVRFDSLSESLGGRQLHANYNPFTGDWFFAENGRDMPYNCYYPVDSAKGFSAAPAGAGIGQDYYLYLNNQGITQLVSESEASELNLLSNGYHNLGAVFNTTTNTHFNFDSISYLVANKDNQIVQSSVKALSDNFVNTSDINFVEAVEQIYFAQAIGQPTVVGVDGNSSLADLNILFQTHFVA